MECRQFDTDSLDETNLFWKAREGWRVIETTAFGLENPPKDMDDYISQCSTSYVSDDAGDFGYIGHVLEAVRADLQV